MNNQMLDLTIKKLIELHPELEHISTELKNSIRDSEFEPEQIFAISLLVAGISRESLSSPLRIIQKQLESHEKLREQNTKIINMTAEQVINLQQNIKSFLVEFVDSLNSQFESENIDIKINLEIV